MAKDESDGSGPVAPEPPLVQKPAQHIKCDPLSPASPPEKRCRLSSSEFGSVSPEVGVSVEVVTSEDVGVTETTVVCEQGAKKLQAPSTSKTIVCDRQVTSRAKKDLKECVASELSSMMAGAKFTEPFLKDGFSFTLDAPTSGLVKKGDDSLTYLNKDQFYGVMFEFTPTLHHPRVPCDPVTSLVMLQFREKKEPQDTIAALAFWQARQHSHKVRLIDVDLTNSSGIIDDMKEVAHNAVVLRWNPSHGSAFANIAIRCLSTDFTSQKGVKGIPLHIQIDTYDGATNALLDRSFLQIKTFCDKGAERKAREEEKRLLKHHQRENGQTSYTVSNKSVFQKATDLVTEPVLFTPDIKVSTERALEASVNFVQVKKEPSPLLNVKENKVLVTNPPSSSPSGRVMLYARQENESVYTALHVVPPTVQGLVRAVSTKYEIDSVDIRFLFRQTNKGILVRIDDDMIKYYSNGDVFIMRVLATEDSESGQVFYDVVFLEESESNPEEKTDVSNISTE